MFDESRYFEPWVAPEANVIAVRGRRVGIGGSRTHGPLDAGGDILVFLPTERDIREMRDLLEGRKSREIEVVPLFGD